MVQPTNPPYGPGDPTGAPAYPAAPGYPTQPGYYPSPDQQQLYPTAQVPGYGAPMQGYGVPAVPISTPGTVVGAAVLSYIQSAMVIVGAVVFFIAASLVNQAANSLGADSGVTGGVADTIAGTAILWGIANLILAAGFIIGGVRAQTGKGRLWLYIAAGVNTVYAIVIMALSKGQEVTVPIIYVVLPIIAVILAAMPAVTQWEAARRQTQV